MQTDNGRLRFAVELDNAKLRSDAMESERILNDIGKTAAENGDRMDEMLNKVGKGFASIVSIGAFTQLAKQIVSVRGEIQSLEVAFNTLTGSAEVGGKLLADIRQFAVSTPMQMNDLAKGAQTLLSFNTAAEDVMPILKALGDISMGDSAKFQSLTLAFSQMSSTGKLMGQDLMQMINAGFNPLSVISEQTGKSIGELKDEMSKGAISAEMVKQAFMDATSEGGKFNGMLEAQSKTLNGAMSNLQGAIQDMFNSIGEASEGAIVEAVNGATELVKNYEKVGSVLMGLVATYGAYKAAVMTTTAVKNISMATAHYEEAKALRVLLTAEQQEALAKSGLQATDEAYYVEVKKIVAANLEESAAVLKRAQVEVSASSAVLKQRRAEYLQAKNIVAAKKQELAAAIESGEAKKIEAAQTALSTAEDEKNAAAKVFQAAAADKNAKQTAVETAAKAVNSAQTAVNTAAQTANTASTNVLAVAKTRLISVMNKLKAAIMSNPYAAVAAAIIAIVVAVYKLATAETEAEKAQKAFNEAMNKGMSDTKAEIYTLDQMFTALKNAKEGTLAFADAKQAVVDKYGKYLDKLDLELDTLQDIEKAHLAVRDAMIEEARARMKTEALETAANSRAQTETDAAEIIRYWATTAGHSELVQPLINYARKGELINYLQLYHNNFGKVFSAFVSRRMTAAFNMIADAEDEYNREVERINSIIDPFLQDIKDGEPVSDNSKTDYTLKELRAKFEKETDESKRKEIGSEIKDKEKLLKVNKEIEDQIKWLKEQIANVEAGSKEEKDLNSRINALNKKLTKNAGNGGKDAEQMKLNQQRLADEIRDYYEGLADADKDAELDLRQKENDLRDEGYEKSKEQIAIDYERRKLDIARLQKRYIAELLEIKRKEWEKENPDADKSEWDKVKPELTFEDLDERQQAYLKGLGENNEKELENSLANLLKNLLKQYETYGDARRRILKKYADERSLLYEGDGTSLKSGVTQEVVEELNRQESEALKDLDESYAQRSEEYKDFVDDIAAMKKEDIQQKLQEIEEQILEVDESSMEAAILRAMKRRLEAKLKEFQRKEHQNEDKDNEEKLAKEEAMMREYASAVFQLADAFGILDDEVGSAFASMVKNVVGSRSAFEAGVNFIVGAINLIKTAAISSQRSFEDGIQREVDTFDRYIDDHRYQSFDEFYKDFLGFDPRDATARYNYELLFDVKKLGYSEEKLRGFVATLMSSLREFAASGANFAGTFDVGPFIENTTRKLEEMNRKLAELEKHPKRNKDEIEEYIQAIEDASYEYVQLMTSTFDNILGGFNSMTGQLADSIIRAFDEGTDAANAWGDKVDDIIKNIARNVLIGQIIEKPLSDYINRFMQDNIYYATGGEGRLGWEYAGWFDQDGNIIWDNVVRALPNIARYMDQLGEEASEAWSTLIDSIGISTGADREGMSKGIAQASQESVDELNGRMTAIQGHTYTINENTRIITANTQLILNSVLAIEAHTSTLHSMQTDMAGMRSDINEILNYGVRINV